MTREELTKIAQHLRSILLGQKSVTFDATVKEVFITPNQQLLAEEAYRQIKENNAVLPLKELDSLTIGVALDNGKVIGIKHLLLGDHPELMTEELLSLPDMIDLQP